MKFMCLGYYDETFWDGMSAAEIQALTDACFTYDLHLQETGHWLGGDALASTKEARTIWMKNGKVTVMDGPFAETKEQIGGVLYLEARDLNEAVELMSKHPGVANGPFEIRPVNTEFPQVFEQWRAQHLAKKNG